MRKIGYQTLGFALWQGGKFFIRSRYGNKPRKVALGGTLFAVLAALVLAGRKASTQ